MHNIILSMPSGTSPQRLLAACRDFSREEFALKHRYAMVLHTDQAHPHVHLVVSAYNREATPLNIRKATFDDGGSSSLVICATTDSQRTRHQRRSGGGFRTIKRTESFGPRSAANHESSGSANTVRIKPPNPIEQCDQQALAGSWKRLSPCSTIG